jgi:hypothetical protein
LKVVVIDRCAAVTAGFGQLGVDVLVERAAKGDVQQLQAAAHAKDGLVHGGKSLH